MNSTTCDILIVGGGTGGCAAAMAATSMGLHVVMTEPYNWIGGQLTSQAVPPDEHPWIEQFGCTARYRRYRDLVRAWYRSDTPLTEAARSERWLNPGGGWVSKLCHEPKIGWEVLRQMLSHPLLDVRLHRIPVRAEVHGDQVLALVLKNLENGDEERVEANYFLDATELGDLLPITGTEYITGAESKRDTGEPHAVDGDQEPHNVQGLTWVMALGYDAAGDHTIEKPAQYDYWRTYRPSFWPDNLLSFKMLDVRTLEPRDFPLFGNDRFNLFEYRQIVDPTIYEDSREAATIANWPQNDYFDGNIIDEPADVVATRLEASRQLSLSFLYWLQSEGGYPGLHLRPDLTGTPDGLAQAPYIRESRRIKAQFTVLEQHVAAYTNEGRDRAADFPDSVGIGAYRLDLHPSTSGANTIDTSSLPFQIPLGSLIPVRMRNLLPACKNLGVTHLTNGCYRLHPVEWNIGESAGLLAAFCLQSGLEPAQVWASPDLIKDFQELCMKQGIEIEWPRLYAL
ncbi:MAG: FAD-dependent oxidoreductase [Chlorobia bacterium]|nr:FAD-dependent oxidoreductase [Fimbriimonadaceae bacterium]